MDTLRSYCDQIDSLALEVTRDYTSDPNLYRAIFQKFSEQSEVIISSAPKKLRKHLYVYLADLLLDLFSFENFAYPKEIAKSPEFIQYSIIVAKLDINDPKTDLYRAVDLLIRGKK